MSDMATVERAFQLARYGNCRDISDLERRLKAERYERARDHLAGRSLRRELLSIMKARQSA